MSSDPRMECFSCRECGAWNQGRMLEPRCAVCGTRFRGRAAGVHASERAVVYFNPMTGEHRTPPRADLPMPESYRRAGFERREIHNMTQWERASGAIHEASTFAPGNEERESVPERPKLSPEVVREMIPVAQGLMDAARRDSLG